MKLLTHHEGRLVPNIYVQYELLDENGELESVETFYHGLREGDPTEYDLTLAYNQAKQLGYVFEVSHGVMPTIHVIMPYSEYYEGKNGNILIENVLPFSLVMVRED